MARSLTALGLGLLAALALSAMVVSTAVAQKFATDGYPAIISGAQVEAEEHAFKIENDTLEVRCPVVEFLGGISGEVSEFSGVSAKYQGKGEATCKAFGLNAIVSTEGCTYTFRTTAIVSAGMEDTGTFDLVCPAGKALTIVTATCEVKIGTQTKLSPISYIVDTLTLAEKNLFTFKPKVSKSIKYEKTKDGIGCPLVGTGAKSDGSYAGNTTVIPLQSGSLVRTEGALK